MTAQQPEGPQTGNDGQDEAAPVDGGQQNAAEQHDQDRSSPNREAAKYRTRLREVETERDGLVARVERHQLADVARLVDGRLAQPDDLLAYGVQLSALLDDQGDVDPALVDTALLGLLDARPGLAAAAPSDGPRFPDLGGGKRGASTDAGGSSWGQVIGQERVRG